MEDMKRLGKEQQFNGLEFPKKIYCSAELFSVENDILTPTFKLKRAEARKVYYVQIKEMYGGAKLQGEE